MNKIITDGSSAVGEIAYKLSEIIPIYPITPSSPMAEFCSQLNSKKTKNIFDEDVKMIEMQSEGGVAGTMHGALLSHAFSCTFTSSQGLLLMIPNMYKIAGEGLPSVIHVAARAVATHALSIFCDHSDVMSARMTGYIILNSCSVQESYHMALAAHTLAMKNRLPVLHFFDGFRTSHEIQKINTFSDDEIKLIIKDYFDKFKNDYQIRQYGTAQNPDVYFQNRERSQIKYDDVAKNLKEIFKDINSLTHCNYDLYEYYGANDAEQIIVSMGSSCKTIEEYIDNNKDKKIGLIKVRLYRPFFDKIFIDKIPKTTKIITTLDRTKENGAVPPLALDVMSAIQQNNLNIKVLTGRYGLGGKDFTPTDVNTVFENMLKKQLNNFTVGINDDVNHNSLKPVNYKNKENSFEIKIFGLGSDGSVSASKSTIKILGENYNKNVQGYFEYDSKKSGSLTISHLRLSNKEIKSEYLLSEEDVISINNFSFVTKYNCLEGLRKNGIVLINSIFNKNEIDKVIPSSYVKKLKETNSKLFVINAQKIANECGLGQKINIIMQTALLKCSKLLNDEQINEEISKYIKKMFYAKGQKIIDKNILAMQKAMNLSEEVDVNSLNGKIYHDSNNINDEFYNNIMKPISQLDGNSIPVSKFSIDGSSPLGTSKYEKRSIALNLPNWIKENCIQCGQCVLACPHSALKALLIDEDSINDKDSFIKALGLNEKLYKILLSPEDCTGCGVCSKTCPALKKALNMTESNLILEEKKKEYSLFSNIKNSTQIIFPNITPKGLQFSQSLFEFPGACAGCGETPYIKILTMINGSNMLIANATGCSSIYGGTFGSCPYCKDTNDYGIFWANSLFEDNAEFGIGLKLGNDFLKNEKKTWIIGGDGWAYDIGFGGLDHILSSNEDVNILVLDNQTYSNTGGQQSKATPTGAAVKFAENGKENRKKDLGQIALTYKNVYVGQISLGYNMAHAIKTIKEAQDFKGVSIIIAYAPCVNQGFDLTNMVEEMKLATECGFWPIYSYNPITRLLTLNSKIDNDKYSQFIKNERRFVATSEKNRDSLLDKQQEQSFETYNILKNFNNKKEE